MAIDSTLFGAAIPAGTYAVGDKIPMSVVRGPAVVRDGYGAAYLKRLFASATQLVGHVEFKNSNWVDSAANLAPAAGVATLSNNSVAIQSGHDCPLQPNSGWEVTYVVDVAATTTSAGDVVAIIDVDYPSVQAVADPKKAIGTPCSTCRQDSFTITAAGSIASLSWTTYNVDILKAGYKYLLAAASYRAANATTIGFFSISGAAGQAGLERIIPVYPTTLGNLRYIIDYATPLVKGPFNLNYAAIGIAGADTAILEIDWVKKN